MHKLLLAVPFILFTSGCSQMLVFKPIETECYTMASASQNEIFMIIHDKRETKEYTNELQATLVNCLNNNYNVILMNDEVNSIIQSYYVVDIEEYRAWCEKDYCNATTKMTITLYVQNSLARTVPINKTVNLINTFNEDTAYEALQNSLNEAIRSIVNYISVVR